MHPKPRETKLSAKKNRILSLIFLEEGCSRFRLARELNINASMVGIYVKEFLDKGVLREEHSGPTRRGRAPIPVRLNPEHGCFLGIDFESLRARGVVTDFTGTPILQKEIEFPPGVPRQAVLGRLIVLGKELVRESSARRLLAVGVACPGQVDVETGRIVHYDLLDDFRDVPILDLFAPQFPAPIVVDRDIRAITLAEQLRGAGRGHRNFLCLAVRSGVDVGITIDGKIYTGAGALAGRVDRNIFPVNGVARPWAELVSATGIAREIAKSLKTLKRTELRSALARKGESLSLADVVVAAEQGDKAMRDHLQQVGRYLGMMLANLANIFAPEKIILVGDVPNCSPHVRDHLDQAFEDHTLPEIRAHSLVVDGAMTTYAGSIGAAYLGFLHLFPVEEQTA